MAIKEEENNLSPAQQILSLFGQLSVVEKEMVMAELQLAHTTASSEQDEEVYVPTTAVSLDELLISRAPPMTDITNLVAPWWPDEDSADDINNFVRQLRKKKHRYGQTQTPDWEM